MRARPSARLSEGEKEEGLKEAASCRSHPSPEEEHAQPDGEGIKRQMLHRPQEHLSIPAILDEILHRIVDPLRIDERPHRHLPEKEEQFSHQTNALQRGTPPLPRTGEDLIDERRHPRRVKKEHAELPHHPSPHE